MESERPSASLLASELVFPDRVPRLHYLPFASSPLDLDPSAPLSFPRPFLCDPSFDQIRFYATESSSNLLSTSGSIFFSFQKDQKDSDREQIGKDSIFVRKDGASVRGGEKVEKSMEGRECWRRRGASR